MGKLSDAKLRGIKPTATIRKYTDGDGLFLKVTPKGGMYWQQPAGHAAARRLLWRLGHARPVRPFQRRVRQRRLVSQGT